MVRVEKHITEDPPTQWQQDRQPRWSVLCTGAASQCGTWITGPRWHRSCQYSLHFVFI